MRVETSLRAKCGLRQTKDLVEDPGAGKGVKEEETQEAKVRHKGSQKPCVKPQGHDRRENECEPAFEACSMRQAPSEAPAFDSLLFDSQRSKAKPSTGPTNATAPTSYSAAWRMRRALGVMSMGRDKTTIGVLYIITASQSAARYANG